jgi:hypothetical protein
LVRVRRAAPTTIIASSALALVLTREALAECRPTAPCVDAEPMWQSPSAVRFTVVSDTAAPRAGALALGASLAYRFRPAVLTVPAPNQDGRNINLVSHALAWSLVARWGIGNRLELTALAAGLSQRGAGIKGVTTQSAPGIDSPALQDPRIGFGYALLPAVRSLGAKVRLEAKLPFGNAQALAGERTVVASPSFVFSARSGGAFANLELGARLRPPTDFFGLRLGSQGLLAVGVGYEFAGPRLAFAIEQYVLPSLIEGNRYRNVPAEWLISGRWAPASLGALALGAGVGAALPYGGHGGFGAPGFRALSYVRLTPASD